MKKRIKTGGRGAGVPNRITAELRERIKKFLEDNWETIEADFAALDPKDKFLLYEKLLSYALPKLASTEISFEEKADSDLIKRARQRAEDIANGIF